MPFDGEIKPTKEKLTHPMLSISCGHRVRVPPRFALKKMAGDPIGCLLICPKTEEEYLMPEDTGSTALDDLFVIVGPRQTSVQRYATAPHD